MKRVKVFATALAVIVGMLTLTTPARAVAVTGTITNGTSIVTFAYLDFYTDCQAYREGTLAASFSALGSGFSADIPAGTYRALIRPDNMTGAVRSWHSAAATCSQSTPVTVAPGQPLNLIATAGANLTGNVTSSRGGLANGNVYFYRDCSEYTGWDQDAPAASVSASKYEVTVPLGTYRVLIDPLGNPGVLRSWHGAKRSCAKATVITVTGSGTQNLQALSGALVSGTASSSRGAVTNANLYLYRSCDETSASPAYFGTVSAGAFTMTVTPGSYRVRILPYDPTGALDSWNGAKSTCEESQPLTVNGDLNTTVTARAGVRVTGQVRAGSLLGSGSIVFFTDCQAFARGDGSGYAAFNSGSYAASIPAGTYRIWIDPDHGQKALPSFHSGVADCASAPTFSFTKDTTLNLNALQANRLTGSVSNADGLQIAGTVTFWRSCADDGDASPVQWAQIEAGAYAADLPTGTYLVAIDPYAGEPAVSSWHNAQIACGNATPVQVSGDAVLNLRAAGGSAVSGTVTSAGKPVKNGEVGFYATCEDWRQEDPAAEANLSGGAFTASLTDGEYRVRIEPSSGEVGTDSWHEAQRTCAQASVVRVSGTTTLSLVAASRSVVTGTVTGGGAPVQRGWVGFYASCEDYLDGYSEARGSIVEGTYRVTLPDGAYRVLIGPQRTSRFTASWHAAKATCEQADLVTVDTSGTRDLVVAQGAVVRGEVTIGTALAGYGSVYFYPSCAGDPTAVSSVYQGSYEVNLAPGTYRVRVSAEAGRGEIYSWYPSAGSCAQATPITVSSDTALDLAVPAGSGVAGSVTMEGSPAGMGGVGFYATCQDYLDGNERAWGRIEAGRYQALVPDGQYRVRLQVDSGPWAWHTAATCDQATVVNVNGHTPLDLAGPAGIAVQVTVSSSEGRVRNGTVSFFADCADRVAHRPALRTEFGVRPETVRLLPGTYLARIEPASTSKAVRSWHSRQATCDRATPITVTAATSLELFALAPGEVPFTPGPPPVVPPQATPAMQKVRKPPAKLKKGHHAKLAKRTKQGAKLTWRSKTPKICTVKKYTVTARKKGRCKLAARAPAVTGFAAFSRRYTIRIIRSRREPPASKAGT